MNSLRASCSVAVEASSSFARGNPPAAAADDRHAALWPPLDPAAPGEPRAAAACVFLPEMEGLR